LVIPNVVGMTITRSHDSQIGKFNSKLSKGVMLCPYNIELIEIKKIATRKPLELV